MESLNTFRILHQGEAPLLLANVWDARSTKSAQESGFLAVGTSSHAIADSWGYKDGEKISFETLFFIVRHIAGVAEVSVSVDFESGYSDSPKQVAEYVRQFVDIGVAGINLEDGKVQNGKRTLNTAEVLAAKIKAVKAVTDIFINARIDTYTTEHPRPLEEAIERAQIYRDAGADGIFLPLIEKEEDIRSFLANTDLPLNVFTTPKLADYETLGKWGVKRISHGAKQYELLMEKSKKIYEDFLELKDYRLVLG